jgi:hypothetical protein
MQIPTKRNFEKINVCEEVILELTGFIKENFFKKEKQINFLNEGSKEIVKKLDDFFILLTQNAKNVNEINSLLEEKEMFQIEELVYSLYGSIPLQKSEIKNIVKLAAQDKKNEGGKVNLSLVGPIGTCQIDCFVSQQELFKGVSYYL